MVVESILGMRRIFVMGPIGAGKTHLSTRLSNTLNLPVIHLDREFILPNYKRPPLGCWRKRVSDLARLDEWIMDGNFFDALDERFARAQLIVLLDLPQWLCALRTVKRTILNLGQTRYDLGLPERLNLTHLSNAFTYKARRSSKFQQLIDRASAESINLVKLQSKGDVKKFLLSIRESLDSENQ